MNARYIAMWAIILLLLVIRSSLPNRPWKPPAPSTCQLFEDAESTLACGQRLYLSQVDLYDLELIPGLSDALGNRILAKRDDINRKARLLPELKSYQAFEIVKGIGPKKAAAFSEHIDLTR